MLPRTIPNTHVYVLSTTTKGKRLKSPTGLSKRVFFTKKNLSPGFHEREKQRELAFQNPKLLMHLIPLLWGTIVSRTKY